MKAIRLHNPLDVRYEMVDKPTEPGPGEVRVRVAFAGICGSDIHNFKTGQWISRRPSVVGHEFSGWVDAVGSNVAGLEIGNKVIADSRYYCQTCNNCRLDQAHLCNNLGFVGEVIDGGFAEFAVLPANLLLKCSEDTQLDIAALAEPLAVALHALKRLQIPDTEPLLIIGCGPIGALSAVASRYHSKRPLVVSDVNKQRECLINKLTGAMRTDLNGFNQFDNPAGKPVRFILDTTGNVGVISKLVAEMVGCTIGLVGIGTGDFAVDPVHLVERELSIIGCHAFSDELPVALDMIEKAPEKFAELIGSKISLEDTPDAYQALSDGKSAGIKTMIVVHDDNDIVSDGMKPSGAAR
ncbi:MAG: alcohol dehydrogenase catalytic domain-containing protein [Stappiaceae bacterium]